MINLTYFIPIQPFTKQLLYVGYYKYSLYLFELPDLQCNYSRYYEREALAHSLSPLTYSCTARSSCFPLPGLILILAFRFLLCCHIFLLRCSLRTLGSGCVRQLQCHDPLRELRPPSRCDSARSSHPSAKRCTHSRRWKLPAERLSLDSGEGSKSICWLCPD